MRTEVAVLAKRLMSLHFMGLLSEGCTHKCMQYSTAPGPGYNTFPAVPVQLLLLATAVAGSTDTALQPGYTPLQAVQLLLATAIAGRQYNCSSSWFTPSCICTLVTPCCIHICTVVHPLHAHMHRNYTPLLPHMYPDYTQLQPAYPPCPTCSCCFKACLLIPWAGPLLRSQPLQNVDVSTRCCCCTCAGTPVCWRVQ